MNSDSHTRFSVQVRLQNISIMHIRYRCRTHNTKASYLLDSIQKLLLIVSEVSLFLNPVVHNFCPARRYKIKVSISEHLCHCSSLDM